MTLPPRPENMPEIQVDSRGYIGIRGRGDRTMSPTNAEAAYIVSLVNAAPAIEAELSALREARREQEEELTRLRSGTAFVRDAAVEELLATKGDLGATIDELRALVRELCDTWDRTWDCSRHPGHEPMNAAVEKARAAIGSTDTTGQAGGGG